MDCGCVLESEIKARTCPRHCNPRVFNEIDSCGECPSCVTRSKHFVNEYKRVPLNRLSAYELKALTFASLVLKVRFGFEGFQLFVKQGET